MEEKIINNIEKISFEDLGDDVIRYCKKLILDSLAVAFPGSRAPGCRETVELLGSWQCINGASVLFSDLTVSPPQAAMVNSAMMHALDFDDTLDDSALHTFVSVLPAVLAAAESKTKISGKRFIAALVLGTDLVCRLSLAIDRPLSWIRTATCGSFGAAAGAAKILGMDKEGISNALGIVYAQTAGNAQGLIEGRLVKRMQPGFAASAGVLSALLSNRGITGSRQFLTGPYGFYPLYEQNEYYPERALERLGDHFTILDLSIKPYPSCRMTHSCIDAALKLKKRIGRIGDIDRIDVSVSSMVAEMVGKSFQIGTNPQVDAQFSIPYTTACALIRGDVFLRDFETEFILDPEIKKTAGVVHVSVNQDLPQKDIFQAEMRITKSNGEVLSEFVSVPRGNPENPMSDEECRNKFNKCVDYSGLPVADEDRRELISMVENIEMLSDVRDLIGPMRF
ncbi:MAG: MmgE/PrpD family protein [Desulfobacteraceae bacterium]|nr:MmgE/PrpD family protein [Desulfobacteraceae bacterium]